MRILLVEDDESLIYVLTIALTRQNYSVDIAPNGETGWEMAQSCDYDLILLDVVLPKLDGITLCQQLRQQASSVPIILLTAKDTTNDKLLGLDAGADDYVVKPFELEVLSARIRALLRRGTQAVMPLLTWGCLTLDPNSREVSYHDRPLHLSRREYQILELFLRNPRRVFDRRAILDQIWSFEEEAPTEDTVKSHIKSIRHKFKTVGADKLLETLYGQGYRLNPTYQTVTMVPQTHSPARPELFTLEEGQEGRTPLPSLEADLAAELAQIWQRTKGSTLSRVQDLEALIQTLQQKPLEPDQLDQAVRTAHKLAGSLGTFGLIQGSDLARDLESCLQIQMDPQHLFQIVQPKVQELSRLLQTDPLDSVSLDSVSLDSVSLDSGSESKLLEDGGAIEPRSQGSDLTCNCSASLDPQGVNPQPFLPELAPEAENPRVHAHASSPGPSYYRSLLVVESDQGFCQTLMGEASTWKTLVKTAQNLEIADRLLQAHRPDAVLLNIDCIRVDPARERFFRTVMASQPAPSFLALSDRENLVNRLKALELGAQILLQKPTTATQVFTALSRVLELTGTIIAKVLVVDDDLTIVELVQSLLRPRGLQTLGLQEPDQFWETLKTVQPDLLILDIEMPAVDGLSLCHLVRNDFQWSWLPILFLTSHTDVQTLQRAFFAGADDFITKPIVPEQFVVRVMNRLQRSRLYRNQMEVDLLTGIANRHGGTRNFDQLLHLAIQSQRPLCLATIDLDHFKQVNDQYGHEEGDRVLHEFGEFLKRKCRAGDVLARWGGEEFIVGMLGLSRDKGVARIEEILADWRGQTLQTATGKQVRVSFSAGVAQYPLDGLDFQVLYRTADAALYRAKAAGRNRVIAAD